MKTESSREVGLQEVLELTDGLRVQQVKIILNNLFYTTNKFKDVI